MDASLALGALLGTAFQKLFEAIIFAISEAHKFKPKLLQLQQRLETLMGNFKQINKLGLQAQLEMFPEKETMKLCGILQNATHLISACSGVHSWDLYHLMKFGKRIDSLLESIDEFLKVDLQFAQYKQIQEVLVKVIEINEKLDPEYKTPRVYYALPSMSNPGTVSSSDTWESSGTSQRCFNFHYKSRNEKKKKTTEVEVNYEKVNGVRK